MSRDVDCSRSNKRLRQMNIDESFQRVKRNCSISAPKNSLVMDKSESKDDIVIDIVLSDEGTENNDGKKEASNSCRVEEDDSVVRCTSAVEDAGVTLSPILFPESCGSSSECSSTPKELNMSLGFPIDKLRRHPECMLTLPSLTVDDPEHTVLFRPHFRNREAPRPFPETCRDKWDNNHVRMPCSPDNLYPVEDQHGVKKLERRWSIIKRVLSRPMKSSLDLEESIMTYNARYKNKWDFSGLHYFFTEVLSADAIQYFFSTLLPQMSKLALDLPRICTQAIPLLRRQTSHTITLSQKQIACLLANAFFCTFPRRNAQRRESEYATFPEINFNGWFVGSKDGQNPRISEKLKCILHYFKKIMDKEPDGCVTFQRRVLGSGTRIPFPDWENEDTTLREYHVKSEGTIEEDGIGMLQIDFANKYVGGGVLRSGCVQEEIRFVICPELLISRLFTEVLESNECLIATGCEQYSKYTGYADDFQWEKNHEDTTPRDSWNRRCTEIVAMDATHFRVSRDQYNAKWLKREINKAYCGFYGDGKTSEHLTTVATGNWGCGAFRGAPHLKSLLQFMAASVAGRDMLYFTFHNTALCEEIHNMLSFLKEQNVTVGEIWKILLNYNETFPPSGKRPKVGLFVYIQKVLDMYYANTDSDNETEKRESRKQRAEQAKEDVMENYEDHMLLALYSSHE